MILCPILGGALWQTPPGANILTSGLCPAISTEGLVHLKHEPPSPPPHTHCSVAVHIELSEPCVCGLGTGPLDPRAVGGVMEKQEQTWENGIGG